MGMPHPSTAHVEQIRESHGCITAVASGAAHSIAISQCPKQTSAPVAMQHQLHNHKPCSISFTIATGMHLAGAASGPLSDETAAAQRWAAADEPVADGRSWTPLAETDLCLHMSALAPPAAADQQELCRQLPPDMTRAAMRRHVDVFKKALDGLQRRSLELVAIRSRLFEPAAQPAADGVTLERHRACMATPEVRLVVAVRSADVALRTLALRPS